MRWQVEQANVPSQAPVRAAEAQHAVHCTPGRSECFSVFASATTLSERDSLLKSHESGVGPQPHMLSEITHTVLHKQAMWGDHEGHTILILKCIQVHNWGTHMHKDVSLNTYSNNVYNHMHIIHLTWRALKQLIMTCVIEEKATTLHLNKVKYSSLSIL